MEPSITTFRLRHLNPLDIKDEDIDIFDIAHHLALCNRFAGATRWPISVAQHSLGVSILARKAPLQGLLHDASEAYLGDVTKWLKQSPVMLGYREAEDRAQRAIYRHFGLPEEDHATVTEADKTMVRLEYHLAVDSGGIPHPSYPAVSPTEEEELLRTLTATGWLYDMTWRHAERAFMERFYMFHS